LYILVEIHEINPFKPLHFIQPGVENAGVGFWKNRGFKEDFSVVYLQGFSYSVIRRHFSTNKLYEK